MTSTLDEVHDEPVTDAILFPTMSDLNNISCRRSSRMRKQPERYGGFKSAMTVKRIFRTFLTCSAYISLGNLVTAYQCPDTSLVQRACLHIERINTHFDGTINQMHHAVLATAAGNNDTYNHLKKMFQQEDEGGFIQEMMKEVQDHEMKEQH